MEQDKKYILSLSYGKDSLACLGAIERLGWPLDGIVHAEVWATDTIPADLPPMVEFKAKADAIIKERWGIDVQHVCALNPLTNCSSRERERERRTYDGVFYDKYKSGKKVGQIYGFPMTRGAWCNDRLKVAALNSAKKLFTDCTVQYIGIAVDEPDRLSRLDGITKISPLAKIGWTEEDCKNWCIENNLLSPIYTNSTRGGCWFCHNQGVDQLRILRSEYPHLWDMLLSWDNDSPCTFKPDGHTVHDYELRFQLEDDGRLPKNKRFLWKMLDPEYLQKLNNN